MTSRPCWRASPAATASSTLFSPAGSESGTTRPAGGFQVASAPATRASAAGAISEARAPVRRASTLPAPAFQISTVRPRPAGAAAKARPLPGAPSSVAAQAASNANANGVSPVQVTWGPADAAGAPSVSYRAYAVQNGTNPPCTSLTGTPIGTTSGATDNDPGRGSQRYAVVADNGVFELLEAHGVAVVGGHRVEVADAQGDRPHGGVCSEEIGVHDYLNIVES